MDNEEKKYASLNTLFQFLENIKVNFATKEYVDNLFQENIQALENMIDESGVLDE